MPFGSFYDVLLAKSSCIIKRRGERRQPCLTPVVTKKESVTVPPYTSITWQVKFLCNLLRNLIMHEHNYPIGYYGLCYR